MASSRKDAPAFTQTWDETDAAFLDPTSLPIAKVPRAWDRKQEVKTVKNGKKKEIWRTYGTRSRTSGATASEDAERDARTRPVKRLQRMSPKAIEKSAASRFGRTNAFKATRWDRRKSVLPRKKAVGASRTVEDHDDADEQDKTITDFGNDSFSEMKVDDLQEDHEDLVLLPENGDVLQNFEYAPTEHVEDGTSASISIAQVEEDATMVIPSQTSAEAPAQEASSTEDPTCLEVPKTEREIGTTTESEPSDCIKKDVEEDAQNPSTSTQVDNITEDECDPLMPATHRTMYEPRSSTPTVEQATDTPEQDGEIQEQSDNEFDEQDVSPDEEFTEASLQLNIQQDVQTEGTNPLAAHGQTSPINSSSGSADDMANAFTGPTRHVEDGLSKSLPSTVVDPMDDITSGLTLGPTLPFSREPTPRKLRSPSPPPRLETGPEDTTVTFAFGDDTALLKDFLSRAAASKANKAENIARRESLQNRRDSDVVRHALSSPRKALEDKDPNSPSKCDTDATLDMSQTLTIDADPPAPGSPSEAPTEAEAEAVDDPKASRRSSRARKSRIPASSSMPPGPPKIAVKRDGGDPIILKKTDAMELSLLTRANTRKNKQGAVAVNVRLLKLSSEARPDDNSASDAEEGGVAQVVPGKKYVRWDSQLAYFAADTEAIANALADAESLATPDELSLAPPSAKPTKVKTPRVVVDKNATPKVRKVRSLGSKNGTPGKGLLAPSALLPESMLDDTEDKQRLPKHKSSRGAKKMAGASTDAKPLLAPLDSKLPALEVAPVGIGPTSVGAKERKSRLATPKKVKLPQQGSAVLGDGKENHKAGPSAASPRKGVVPSAIELVTGLPKRRGRKL